MKNTFANIIRNFLFGNLVLLVLAATTFAAPVVRNSAGAGSLEILNSVIQFRQDLGGADNGVGGSRTNGLRLLDWENAPQGTDTPANFYNSSSPRGAVLSSVCTNDSFKVSEINEPRFGDIPGGAAYANSFRTFSGQRLFSAYSPSKNECNITEVYFYIPGTKIPATVRGFGVVFTDVDFPASASVTYYGIDGAEIIPSQSAMPANNGLSFLGVSFNAGERIARVRIESGNIPLGVTENINNFLDVVVMDDFIYGEPRAVGRHSSDFDGDGTSDYAVFRPSNGTWYILNSGSNTFSGVQFGQAGDVPVDGDFDGDSRNDVAVFRPPNGAWYVLRSSNGQFQGTVFGQTGDKPIAGDYDKDGKSDIAVWRPSTGTYYYLKSSNGQFSATQFGANGDVPIGAGVP